MRITAEYPLPEGARLVFRREDGSDSPRPPRVEFERARVIDPVIGPIGHVVSTETTERYGRTWLVLTLDIDDKSAVVSAMRAGGVF